LSEKVCYWYLSFKLTVFWNIFSWRFSRSWMFCYYGENSSD